jgi:PKD repeat protein
MQADGDSRRRSVWVLLAVIAAAAILIAVATIPGINKKGGQTPGGNNPAAPRAKIQTDRVNAYENEAVSFSGASSEGDIVGYGWDLGDGAQADGAAVRHAYATVGKFTVTLTVRDVKGQSNTDTAYIHIDHDEKQSGTVSMGQSKSYAIPVEVDCMGARITLTYPTGSLIGGVPSNNLDITAMFPNGTAYIDSHDQPPDAGSTQTEELTIPSQEMAANQYKDWTVKVSAETGLNVKFELEIEVTY